MKQCAKCGYYRCRCDGFRPAVEPGPPMVESTPQGEPQTAVLSDRFAEAAPLPREAPFRFLIREYPPHRGHAHGHRRQKNQ